MVMVRVLAESRRTVFDLYLICLSVHTPIFWYKKWYFGQGWSCRAAPRASALRQKSSASAAIRRLGDSALVTVTNCDCIVTAP